MVTLLNSRGLRKMSMLIFALLPLLSWYEIPFPVSLGSTLILFLSTFVIFFSGFKVNIIPSSLFIVFLYVCIMWTYNHNFAIWTLLPPGGWTFFIFILGLLLGIMTYDQTLLKKYMRWIVLISGTLFWIQFVLVLVTGSPQICVVPNLTGSFIYEHYSYADIVAKHLSGSLPSSIFLEKSYLAYYFLTYLALLWFDNSNANRFFSKETLFVILTLLVSKSGTALVGFSVLAVVKIFSLYWNTDLIRRVLLIIMIIPILLGVTYTYISTEIGQQMLSRTEEFSNEGSSGYVRVVGGYIMFESLTPTEQIFGIPDARKRFGYEKANGDFVFYVNGIQSILLNLGYVGAILYLLFYASIFRKVALSSKMCLIVLLVMSLLESNYLNSYMMLLTIVPCSEIYLNRNSKKNENYYVGIRHTPRSH